MTVPDMRSRQPENRPWWRAPRRLSERDSARRVTFLELFYDLVYVVIVAQIGHFLAQQVDLIRVLEAAFLFLLAWIAWVNGSMYHELHGQNDLRTGIFTFGQMFSVAGMAVFVNSAFEEGANGFVLSFVVYLAVIGFLWWRTGVHDPNHRPFSQPYTVGLLLAILLFGASPFVPESWRLGLWVTALLVLALLPVQTFFTRTANPEIRALLDRSLEISPSAVERFGLFTIIVLGEVIVAVVRGVAEHDHRDWLVYAGGGLGMLLAIGLWWVYFTIIAERIPSPSRGAVIGWLYLHLPLAMGITAVGAATLNVVEHAGVSLTSGVSWLLCGALGLTLISVALLALTIQVPPAYRKYYRRGAGILTGSAVGTVVVGLTSLPTLVMMGTLVALVFIPILYVVRIWIIVFGAGDIEFGQAAIDPPLSATD